MWSHRGVLFQIVSKYAMGTLAQLAPTLKCSVGFKW